jgi:hypothetical protein
MRAIIRFSIDGETDGALSGKLRRYLENKRGFRKLPGNTQRPPRPPLLGVWDTTTEEGDERPRRVTRSPRRRGQAA